MAAETDPTKPLQALDLIFSCNICHESIRDISSPVQETRELEGARKPAAKLWMTECAHLICAKHLEGGAPPFHPAGQAPRAVCPVCVNRQNNRTLKQMYAISGFTKGQYDSEIPHHFFQCPPVALDTKDAGMDALRFQFLGLVTFGIAVATKFRNLQTVHSNLKDQTDKLRLEKTKAETEIQSLTERITFAEEKERKYKAKEPEIKHYLEKFALVKKELDLRNEELRRLGYHPPQVDYTFPPSHLLEDDTSTGRMPTSQTGRSDRGGADQRIVEDYLPSVSSTTLRGDSSRAYTEDDPQRTENKRRKLDEYRYKPHNTQSPSKGPSAQKRPEWRPPPAPSTTRSVPSKSRHFQPPPPMPYRSDNPQPTPGIRDNDTDSGLQTSNSQHDAWELWNQTENAQNPGTRSDDPPYMSGALQPQDLGFNPSALFKPYQQQQRRIQPVDSIDDISRSGFITSGPLPTHITPGQRYTAGGDSTYDSRSVFREPQESYGIYSKTNHHSLPAQGSHSDYRQHQSFEQLPAQSVLPRPQQSPYRESHNQQSVFRPSYDGQLNRPHTPSPQRVGLLQRSEAISVTSPFFRADQPRHSRRDHASSPMLSQMNQQSMPAFRMAPPQRPVQSSSQSRSQTLNGISFVGRPPNGHDHNYEVDMPFDSRQQDFTYGAPRDTNGLFVRPDIHQTPMARSSSRRGTIHSSQHSGRPQPLPSKVPSLTSSINIPHSRQGPRYDGALANIQGVKGGSTSSRGMATELFGPRSGIFPSSRRSIRR